MNKIKIEMSFLVLATMFLMASCGGSASPQNSYASQMTPVIKKLTVWQQHNAKLDALFNDPVTSANGTSMSRMEMIDLYNMAIGYKITREDYVNLGFMPLDILVGEATKLADEGKDILTTLSAVTPDQGAKAAHEAVLKCVQSRVTFAEGLVSSIKNLTAVDLSGDASACSTFDASLQALTDYVNKNK